MEVSVWMRPPRAQYPGGRLFQNLKKGKDLIYGAEIFSFSSFITCQKFIVSAFSLGWTKSPGPNWPQYTQVLT